MVSIVLAVLALCLAPGAASAAPATTNLAQGRTVSGSSSYETSPWGYGKAVDGATGSSSSSMGWSSGDANSGSDHTEWYQVDLGAATSVNKVVLWPRDDSGNLGYGYPVNATVATSVDGTTWTTVWTISNAPLPSTAQSSTFADRTARYVRITGTSLRSNPNDSSRYRMQFAEVEVYGTAAATTRSSITPLADCYTANSDGSYTVVLGYTNPNSSTVTIATGSSNTFNPSTYNSSLPTTFNPGTQHGVASIRVARADLGNPSWTLDGTTLNTTSGVSACSTSQLPMLANGAALVGVLVLAGVVGAVVVRRQRRTTGAEATDRS